MRLYPLWRVSEQVCAKLLRREPGWKDRVNQLQKNVYESCVLLCGSSC